MIELVDYNEVYGKGVEIKEESAVKKTRRAGSRKKATSLNEDIPSVPVSVESPVSPAEAPVEVAK